MSERTLRISFILSFFGVNKEAPYKITVSPFTFIIGVVNVLIKENEYNIKTTPHIENIICP
jgi:hypothetical protein